MKVISTLFFVLFFFAFLSAQDQNAIIYGKTITENDLKNYMHVLASDSLEGRETGKKGQKFAAAYISTHFEKIGLKKTIGDNYFQEFSLSKISPNASNLSINEKTFKNDNDFIVYGNQNLQKELKVVFVGNGDEADYRGINVKGKAVAMIVTDIQQFREKRLRAQEKGAELNILIAGMNKIAYDEFVQKYGSWFDGESFGFSNETDSRHATIVSYGTLVFPCLNQSIKSINTLMAKTKKAKRVKKNIYQKMKEGKILVDYSIKEEKVNTENVLGLAEGTDLKDEIIVITGHYDHEGIKNGKIYNGADDDASGTVGVMELAEAFAIAKKEGRGPRRSILFMAVTGEEKGLLGSQYYSEHPVFPLSNTVTNLNIDMIGRVDEAHAADSNYVYIIGSTMLSMELHELSESINNTYVNIGLDYKYNDKNDPNRYFYRSDHYNFAKHGIPVIFYFNGTHADYHKPTDTIEKIDFRLLKKRTELIYYTAWELANRDTRVQLTEK